MESWLLVVVTGFVIVFGLVSRRLASTPVTAPMVFTAFGVLIGTNGLGIIESGVDDALALTVLELTLVLLLFTDAARIHLGSLRRQYRWPLRMLAVGMPAAIVLGTLAGLGVLTNLGVWELAVLAVILAPTDAALGQAVMTIEAVPQRVRQTLNVESGLNDGLALPALAVALALAGAGEQMDSLGGWVRLAVHEIGVAVMMGTVLGWAGGRLFSAFTRSGWMGERSLRISTLALALLAFASTELLGASGFIAAFIAGMVMGNTARDVCSTVYEYAETEGQLLTLITFLFFGGLVVGPAVEVLTWRTVVYAILSLTVVRVGAIAVSLLGAGARASTVAFMGWFGPRGVASIVFALTVVEAGELEVAERIFAIVAVTVLISIFVHGLSARPLAIGYGRSMSEMEEEEMAEARRMPELPLRF